MRSRNENGEEFSVFPPALPFGKLPLHMLTPLDANNNPLTDAPLIKYYTDLLSYRYAINAADIFINTTNVRPSTRAKDLLVVLLQLEGNNLIETAQIMGLELAKDAHVEQDNFTSINAENLHVRKCKMLNNYGKALIKKRLVLKKRHDIFYPTKRLRAKVESISQKLNLKSYELFDPASELLPHANGNGLLNSSLFIDALYEYVVVLRSRELLSSGMTERILESYMDKAPEGSLQNLFHSVKKSVLSLKARQAIEKLKLPRKLRKVENNVIVSG